MVLTAVDPVFTAGVDFKEERAPGWNPYDNQFTANPGKALRAMATPVVCAVNGACVSGGLELALSSSLVVASERARFADTHARLGVVAAWGLTALLPRAVGIRKATEMSITGNFVDAAEALRIGLVNHVVPAAALESATMGMARRLAKGPALAIRFNKQLVNKELEERVTRLYEMAFAMEAITFRSADHVEAVASFTERRPPTFQRGHR